ncbi:hypothetical protein TCAL_15355 [Tigriopus californicus]|uniref:Uncharacterized protein n=1 Tax=Tigriopus californicus TaxID=6832 RepID=A0A553PKY7_TIGCA|nr:hypothetical protein TCAL_15355 [Tigriopus californicus]
MALSVFGVFNARNSCQIRRGLSKPSTNHTLWSRNTNKYYEITGPQRSAPWDIPTHQVEFIIRKKKRTRMQAKEMMNNLGYYYRDQHSSDSAKSKGVPRRIMVASAEREPEIKVFSNRIMSGPFRTVQLTLTITVGIDFSARFRCLHSYNKNPNCRHFT